MGRGKRFKKAKSLVEVKPYSSEEAMPLIKKWQQRSLMRRLKLPCVWEWTKHADQMVRGTIVLPHGLGKARRFASSHPARRSRRRSRPEPNMLAVTTWLAKIQEGWLDFDALIATPDMMKSVGKLGKVLGPKGLMPNPKTGTVTFDLAKAVQEIKAGKVEFRVDKTYYSHACGQSVI
jgi:large subunit ribosomal protein L1